MNSNSDNPKVGKDFQRKVLSIAQKTFNMPFEERSVNYNARKILAMKKDVRLRTGESLAEYYCRIYGHLLEDIEVWEVAEEGIVNIVRKKQINDSEMS